MTTPLQDINTEWTDTGLAKGWSFSPQHNCQHSVSCSHAPSNVTVPHFPPALNHWWSNAEPTRGRASFSTLRYRSVTGKPWTRTSVKNRCVDDKNTPRCLQPSKNFHRIHIGNKGKLISQQASGSGKNKFVIAEARTCHHHCHRQYWQGPDTQKLT